MLSKEQNLTHQELKRLLRYSKTTGVFTWKVSLSNRVKAGQQAGSNNGCGYIIIHIHGVNYQAHRLAWFYCFGKWPNELLDHKDGNGLNNRIKNLREADNFQNMANNLRTVGANGRGVVRRGRKFAARIRVRNRVIHLGTFVTAELAAQAYTRAAKIHHGEFSSTHRQ